MNADSDDDLAVVKWCMREAFRQNQGRIITWLSEGAPARISIRCRMNVPIGMYLTREMAKPADAYTAHFVLESDEDMPGGFRVVTGYAAP